MVTRNAGSGKSPSGAGPAFGAPTVERGSQNEASGSGIPSKSAGTDRKTSRAGEQTDEQPNESVASQGERQASQIVGQLADGARSFAGHQKDRAADRIGGIAQALKRTGQQVAEQGEKPLGNRLNQAADHLDRFSVELRQKDIESLIDAARDLARRRPVALFTVAVVGGFALSHFLRSKTERQNGDTDSGAQGSRSPADSNQASQLSTPGRRKS